MTCLRHSCRREALFREHPLAANVAETLLHVFVSIEMTGQGVEFEQKFNYRRPMYAILRHIWTINLHREALNVSTMNCTIVLIVFMSFMQNVTLILLVKRHVFLRQISVVILRCITVLKHL